MEVNSSLSPVVLFPVMRQRSRCEPVADVELVLHLAVGDLVELVDGGPDDVLGKGRIGIGLRPLADRASRLDVGGEEGAGGGVRRLISPMRRSLGIAGRSYARRCDGKVIRARTLGSPSSMGAACCCIVYRSWSAMHRHCWRLNGRSLRQIAVSAHFIVHHVSIYFSSLARKRRSSRFTLFLPIASRMLQVRVQNRDG
jgi:hypothetical protein